MARISKGYRQLLQGLQSIDIRNYDDYRSARSAGNYFTKLDSLTENELDFAQLMHERLMALHSGAETNGLHLLLEDGFENINSSHLKKIALYSQATFLPTEGIDAPDWERNRSDFGVTIESGPDLGECLQLAYRFQAHVKSGLLVPLPADVSIIDQDGLWKYHDDVYRGAIEMDIERVYETDVADHTRTVVLPEGVLRVTLEDFEALHKVSLGVMLPPPR